jgi:hypothetical protein
MSRSLPTHAAFKMNAVSSNIAFRFSITL